MPQSYFQMRGRILEFQALGSKYLKKREGHCYGRCEAYHFIRFMEIFWVYSVISREK